MGLVMLDYLGEKTYQILEQHFLARSLTPAEHDGQNEIIRTQLTSSPPRRSTAGTFVLGTRVLSNQIIHFQSSNLN